ncbi:MAG: hypothetical protein KGO02_19215 [Alphaproteobacteria bacterium]|nr:hypothetical protein [Alphaproteobacteria bacterium]
MSLSARPASAWLAALLVIAVALGLIAGNAGELATQADALELACLKAFAAHPSHIAQSFALLAARLAAPMSRLSELFGLAVSGLGLVLFLAWRGLLPALLLLLALVAGAQCLTLWLFFGAHLPVSTLAASLALIAAYAAAALWQWLALRHWRARMAGIFAGGLSQQSLRRLLRSAGDDNLGPHGTVGSCLALRLGAPVTGTDDAGPLPLRERLQALAVLGEIAKSHGGFVTEVSPRGFNVFWNIVVAEPQHEMRACAAALAMMHKLGPATPLASERSGPRFALSIGIATADGAGGVLAAGRQFQYLIEGLCAERAIILRDQAERYGTAIVVCAHTQKAAANAFAFLEVDHCALEQAGEPIELYALWGTPAAAASPKFRALAVFHDRLFQALRGRQWASARELITQCRKLSGASQNLYDLHAARIGWLEQHPPADDWDGAFREPAA